MDLATYPRESRAAALALPLDAALGELTQGHASPQGEVRSARAWLVEEKERERGKARGRVARRVQQPVLIVDN